MSRQIDPAPLADAGRAPPSPAGSAAPARTELLAAAALLLVAGVLLFANLGAKYLWQDEAATAVLGARMMKFGRPLAYDGVNLITMDYAVEAEYDRLNRITGSAEAGVEYYVRRGDFKADTTWIGQPWGSLAVAGASVAAFGNTTVAARAPFAAAALLTVGLLYWFVRREFRSPLLAWLSAALLLANVYWVIHSRQCRYYSVSCLFFMLTLITYARWQRGRPWGASLFVAAAWCWFQMDFGSFWPVVGVLMLLALGGAWPRVRRTLVVGAALGAAVAPWVWYYELAGRLKPSDLPWSTKFTQNFAHVNEFLIPMLVLLAAGVALALRWRALDPVARRTVAAGLAIHLAMLVWLPTVTPYGFHRYVVFLAPLSALLAAWVLVQVASALARRWSAERLRAPLAVALAAFVSVCPLLSNVGRAAFEQRAPSERVDNFSDPLVEWFIRPEWKALHEEVFAPLPDPNRRTVEALARVAAPGDEVLINYEDIPLMFYTDYRIRGGIACFRVEDPSSPPRFFVFRQTHFPQLRPIFKREFQRYNWRRIPSGIPDITWGNVPEPELRVIEHSTSLREVILAENIGPRQPKASR